MISVTQKICLSVVVAFARTPNKSSMFCAVNIKAFTGLPKEHIFMQELKAQSERVSQKS